MPTEESIELTKILEGYYEASLNTMPEDLKDKVRKRFAPLQWDNLSSTQRRAVIKQLNAREEPDYAESRGKWWDHFCKKDEFLQQREQWQRVGIVTREDLSTQESRIAEIDTKIATMTAWEKQDAAPEWASKRVGGPPVQAEDIIKAFRVLPDEQENRIWWQRRLSEVDRYGLSDCRIGGGMKGQGGKKTLWRADLVAVWLLDRYERKERGLSRTSVRSALKRIPGYEEQADELFGVLANAVDG